MTQELRDKIAEIRKLPQEQRLPAMLGEKAAKEYYEAVKKYPLSMGYPKIQETALERIYKQALLYREKGVISEGLFKIEDELWT